MLLLLQVCKLATLLRLLWHLSRTVPQSRPRPSSAFTWWFLFSFYLGAPRTTMWFWRSRERFSMEELRYLNEQLQKATVITDANKDFVVETLRSMAELLIWGDQHDPTFFDFFMEKQVMSTFVRILRESKTITAVAVQLLQTLSIMIQNITSKHARYYLFSNEHINQLITYPFDFQHEELLAYYIIFLRTISMKLDQNTVSFFIKTNHDEVVSFPLYSEAIKFFHHEEGMVRIAVRTITLSVYNVDDASIRKFVMSPQVVGYFENLITFLRQQMLNLDRLVMEAARFPESIQLQGRLESAILETGDLLYYCNDIINAGIPALRTLMTKHIMHLIVLPLLLPAIRLMGDGAAVPLGMHLSTLSALYFLLRLLHIVRHKALVNNIGASLLRTDLPSNPSGIRTKDSEPADNASDLRSTANHGAADNMTDPEDAAAPSSTPEAVDGREALLSYLLCKDDKLVMASLCLLVSFLQNEALDEALLDALGILPRRKRHKKLLLQQLMGDRSEQDGDHLFSASEQPDDEYPSEHWEYELQDEVLSGSATLKNRSQMLDALIRLLCRRPPQCAEVLCQTGWLLRQLLPFQEHKISDSRMSLLDRAYSAAQEDLALELTDCWFDLIPAVLSEEWNVCRKALDTPMLRRDSSFVLMPRTQQSQDDVPRSSSSIFVGERMRATVKVVLVLHQMRVLLLNGSLPEKAPLAEVSEEWSQVSTSATRIGSEVDLADAMSCKVAFERGKERIVYLLVVLQGTSGSLLLVEEITSKQQRGVIRVTAPLAGSDPRVDEKHPTWLHLRIRSPHQPLGDVSTGGPARSSPRMKQLVDGRWTLAFGDAEACKNASSFITQQITTQTNNVRTIITSFLGESAQGLQDAVVVEHSSPP
ncbi:unnamed protein product [Sphagnum balticum]